MNIERIISAVCNHFSEVQAIYLFGSFRTPMERPDSDLDLALLLPPATGKQRAIALGACRDDLESLTGRSVDLINLLDVNTVFQNEIINEGRLIYSADEAATDAFEMKVMSKYQKLNEERAGILEDIESTGRVLP